MPLHVLAHPLAHHLLAELRSAETPPARFREAARKITHLLALQATYGLPTRAVTIQTPLQATEGRQIAQPVAAVPVLRAGLGMLEPVVQLFPDVTVGYIGLERHEETAVARSYYSKLPHLGGCFTLCLDPMLATGGSAAQAIHLIKQSGADKVTMVCVVAAPEGVQRLQAAHPDVLIVTAALDQGLNAQRFIVPGLGDFGDRLYGTP